MHIQSVQRQHSKWQNILHFLPKYQTRNNRNLGLHFGHKRIKKIVNQFFRQAAHQP